MMDEVHDALVAVAEAAAKVAPYPNPKAQPLVDRLRDALDALARTVEAEPDDVRALRQIIRRNPEWAVRLSGIDRLLESRLAQVGGERSG